jgi:hypothetical protein
MDAEGVPSLLVAGDDKDVEGAVGHGYVASFAAVD